jgi:hypothetical protein
MSLLSRIFRVYARDTVEIRRHRYAAPKRARHSGKLRRWARSPVSRLSDFDEVRPAPVQLVDGDGNPIASADPGESI